jgi:hypothetical protein
MPSLRGNAHELPPHAEQLEVPDFSRRALRAYVEPARSEDECELPDQQGTLKQSKEAPGRDAWHQSEVDSRRQDLQEPSPQLDEGRSGSWDPIQMQLAAEASCIGSRRRVRIASLHSVMEGNEASPWGLADAGEDQENSPCGFSPRTVHSPRELHSPPRSRSRGQYWPPRSHVERC